MELQWNIEDLDLLASDLDTSLSGLGGEGHTTFDMSDALSAIQVIKMNGEMNDWNKDHCEQPSFSASLSKCLASDKTKSQPDLNSWNYSSPSVSNSPVTKSAESKAIKKPCRKREDGFQSSERNSDTSAFIFDDSAVEPSSFSSIASAPTLCRTLSQFSLQPGFTMKDHIQQAKAEFQYVLAAATALGSKVGEETLTYLNQGQPYEIRLKKLQGISEMKGKLLKSVLRVGFQERRLQFREKLEIFAWQNQRPSERILDIDLSLSYGIFDVIPDPKNINCCEFMWDPTREASVFLKINCISTEFTCKRRGGEKGVPFRILIETYSHWENPAQKLDSASCLVKVFKSKGADRKHKTDREKLEKLPQAEQRDLQPSYQCTVFTPSTVKVENISFQDFPESVSPQSFNGSIDIKPESPAVSTTEVTTSTPSLTSSPRQAPDAKDNLYADDNSVTPATHSPDFYITADTSPAEAQIWLVKNKFSKLAPSFALYSGKDLLCLNREDMIEICGSVDGIRLYNSIRIRHPPPLKRMYISKDRLIFHGLYLDSLTCNEFKGELCKVFRLNSEALGDIYLTGPDGILLMPSEKVLHNLKDESVFICEILKAEENENYTVILKSYKSHSQVES
ncbi:transcription factor CP2-like isoform X2 [Uloborus diversus]|uniref:transcription factor CP2-like isoform X2 n=1 Tax=Uloborus diversus TaxID=327109 RepID=UPI00240A2431|nr:transcription factor CP2-like isoform X2 [Uloborus diversus]